MRAEIVPITNRVACIDDHESVCYLVKGDKRAMLIDTVNGFEDLREIAQGLTDLPLTVVNTHGHCDHIYGNIYFDEAYMSPDDFELAKLHFSFPDIVKFMFEATTRSMQGKGLKPCPLKPLYVGQVFDLGGVTLEVVDIKGHTPGSIGLLCREERILFGGDGVNRHSWMQLDESLPISTLKRSLTALKNKHGAEFDYVLYGHCPKLLNARIVDQMIKGCDELLSGDTAEDKDYKWFGGVCKSHMFGLDDWGEPMIIAYRPERLKEDTPMRYRELGKTGLMVSEIGLGGEWLQGQSTDKAVEIIHHCQDKGINILDCWMCEPEVRTSIGVGIKGSRDKWYIQGQLGSVWHNGQYLRTRDVELVKGGFEDMLTRFQTDYIDLGLIHFVDEEAEFERVTHGEFWDYIQELKRTGAIRHLGLSTHNPAVGKLAALHGGFEMMLFSVNPAFDMLPPTENIDDYFVDQYGDSYDGIAPERAELYKLCEQRGVGITVMKGYAGGRLFDKERSPFGVALTPVQCLHYALTRPAVASVLVGYTTPEHVDAAVAYETATDEEKDYATVLSGAPRNPYRGQCTYCGHCAPCPKSIDIAMVNKLSDLAKMQPEVPDSLRAHYKALKASARDCVSCGACETRCPFGVKVTERMKDTAAMFGE